MTALNPTKYEELLFTTADRYRRDGYETTVNPPPSAIPFDLGGYQPDLIARKGDLNFLVEIKPQAARTSFDQLRSVLEEVRRHEGWRFVLITGQDVVTEGSIGVEDEQFSWQEIARRFDEAQRLTESGQIIAAYLILWIAFEQMMRFEARRIALPIDRLASSILIRQLYSQGELSMEQFDAALHCQTFRNRLVHGFPAPGLEDALATLSAIVRQLREEWSSS